MADIYRKIIEQGNAGVWIMDKDHVITYVNAKMAALLGYAPEEILGNPIEVFLFEEDLDGLAQNMKDQHRNKLDYAELRFKRKNGAILWTMVSATPDIDEQGNFLGAFAMCTDVTERKQAIVSLHESEERYRLLHENAGLGIGYYTPDGIIVSFNQRAATNMGGKPEDFAGKSFYDLFSKEAADLYMQRLANAIDSDSSQQYEDKLELPTGNKWYVSVYTCIRNTAGEIVGVQIISSDITARKQVEEALYESEDRFRLMYERSPLPYQSLDADGNFLEVNQTWLNTLGYEREEVIGHWFGDFIAPDMVEAFRERFPRFKAAGEVHNEFRMVRKNGEFITVEFDGKVGHDKAGLFKQTHCIFRDVTERQKLHNALQESEERYRTVADYATAWETWIDPDGKYQYCSPSCEQITGYPPEKFTASSDFLLSLVHPDDRRTVEEHFTLDKKDWQKTPLLYRIAHRDGRERWLEHTCRPVYNADGVFLGVRGSDRDVTEQQKLKGALARNEALYRSLVENASNGVMIVQDGVYKFANPAALKLLGRKASEIPGLPITETIHPNSLQSAMQRSRKVIGEGIQNPPVVMKVLRPDGEAIYSESTSIPIVFDGKPAAMVIGQDVTERIAAENALKVSEKSLVRSQQLARMGSWHCNYLTGETRWSDGLYDIYGRKKQDTDSVFDLWLETVHPDDKERVMTLDKRFKAGECDYDTEYRIIRHDNQEVRIIHAISELTRDAEGNLIQSIGVAQDITERVIAENALRDSEKSLVRSQKIARMGSWFCNYEVGSIAWSDSLYEILGYQKGENDDLDEMWMKVLHPDDKRRLIDLERKYKAGESDYELDCRIIRNNDHEIRILHEIAELIYDEDGKPIRSIGVAQDITERVNAATKLRDSEQALRRSQQLAGTGTWSFDYQTGESIWSDGLYDIYGRVKTENDHPTLLWEDTVHPEDKERVAVLSEQAMLGKREYDTEYRIIRQDNQEVRIIHAIAEVIRDEKGVPLKATGVAQDITDRKQAEILLASANAKLEAALASMPDAVFISDEKGRFVNYNEALAIFQRFGSKDEMAAKLSEYPDLLDVFLPSGEFVPVEERAVFRALRGEVGTNVEFTLKRRDSGETWIGSYNFAPYRDGEGNIIGAVVTCQDITDRKRAEDALRGSEERFKKLFTEAPLGISVTDSLTGEYISINPMHAQILGRTVEELLKTTWMEITHEDDVEKDVANMALLNARKIDGFQMEKRFVRPDGSPVWINMTITPLSMEDKTLRWHLCMIEDITDRKQAEDALQKSEANLKKAQATANLGSWTWHNSTNTSEWSNQMFAIFNITRDEFNGNWFEIVDKRVHPDDIHLIKDADNTFRNGRLPKPIEYRVVWPDGSIHIVRDEVGDWVLDKDGETLSLSGITQDITEIRRLTKALEEERNLLAQRVEERTAELRHANAELSKALQAKDEFLANMSHELRTPLTAILGVAEILEMGVRGELNPKQLESMRLIYQSGEHLLELINDILDLSKYEAGKLEIDPDIVVVDDVCQASLALVKGMAHSKNLSASYELQDPALRIFADGRRLKQILVNLMSNAVKFTPEGGEISLEVDLDKEDDKIRFVVEDNGIGISEEDMPRLFQAFEQLDSSLSRKYEGSGLGLALVSRLVALHHGEVLVESEGIPGKGSRFTVVLPWRGTLAQEMMSGDDAVEADGFDLADSETPGEPEHEQEAVVLLAEDNAANALTLCDYLDAFGYQVLHAQDGREAVDMATAHLPDLILMDIHMPVMDGLEAIRCLRKNEGLAQTPILALTALAMPGDLERCLEAGADDYVTKPVSLQVLRDKIKHFLNIENKRL